MRFAAITFKLGPQNEAKTVMEVKVQLYPCLIKHHSVMADESGASSPAVLSVRHTRYVNSSAICIYKRMT
jgi:hypothetical protein